MQQLQKSIIKVTSSARRNNYALNNCHKMPFKDVILSMCAEDNLRQ